MKSFEELNKKYYPPSASMEFYDPETNTFYNAFGEELLDPEEYNQDGEGYTPFGDE
jgi:hypothetical protein